MMPIRVLGASLRGRIAAVVKSAVGQWLVGWNAGELQGAVEVDTRVPQRPLWLGSREAACVREDEEIVAWLHVDDRQLERLLGFDAKSASPPLSAVVHRAESLFDASVPPKLGGPDAKLMTAVMSQAKQALLLQIVESFGCVATVVAEPTVAPISPKALGLGYAEIVVHAGSASFVVLVTPALVARLRTDARSIAKQPLARRAEALLPVSCVATVALDLGEYPLRGLENLSVGQVLPTDVPLARPFEMTVGQRLRLSAFLGRVDDRKAVTLTET